METTTTITAPKESNQEAPAQPATETTTPAKTTIAATKTAPQTEHQMQTKPYQDMPYQDMKIVHSMEETTDASQITVRTQMPKQYITGEVEHERATKIMEMYFNSLETTKDNKCSHRVRIDMKDNWMYF